MEDNNKSCKFCYNKGICKIYDKINKDLNFFRTYNTYEKLIEGLMQEQANNCGFFLNNGTLFPLIRTKRYNFIMSLDEIIKKLITEAEIEEEE